MERVGAVNQILVGDVLDRILELPDESVHCCITSPPYWGLRDYGVARQLGLEATPGEYVDRMVEVFRQVRRVLRADGTLWLNIGDSYAGSGRGRNSDGQHSHKPTDKQASNRGSIAGRLLRPAKVDMHDARVEAGAIGRYWVAPPAGLKCKDMVGIPWMLAFALRADGWWLRSDIIWSKPNPMPESVTDRPTKAHEYLFLLAKSEAYYYDADAIRTQFSAETKAQSFESMDFKRRVKYKQPNGWKSGPGTHGTIHANGREKGTNYTKDYTPPNGANKRTVWSISTEAYPDAHFATFPEKLVEPCILAGSPEGGVVLDPFMGSGTVALVALKASRQFVGIELNPEYADMARKRIAPELAQGRLA